ncbi:NADH-dependent flavin oxidoreductase [Alkalicoccus saliphilus]|uniref:NADH-dependent flavin oxidoreductase n=1 Tax=Alkalicoccus saliphilus TaxID=200989 RepID=A0A2T4U976_9BACI|nr:NADH-dependent flavin oxidoreductase [Alkalicoccus saliphilus]PTL39935.1 NADH-dependent flavin oxidoreductase [Alkalicoccus saliphilus]
MRKFLEPYTFANGMNVKNRIMLAPMTNFSSDEKGQVTPEELAYYRERSRGAGTVITACANVTAGGKGFPGQIGIDRDELDSSLRELASTIQEEGAKAVVQIYHGGRMSPPDLLPDKQPVSASAVAPVREGAVTPRELTEEEIAHIIKAFGQAAQRAVRAGFDGVEIHGANTYLIQQFFSPHSNRRTDKWGGSVEDRMRFPLAVVKEVLQSVKEAGADETFLIGYRFSPEEKEEPGITMEDTMKLINRLAEEKLDYLHVSVQDFSAGSMRNKEDERSRVEIVQEAVGEKIPVVGVGSLYTPDEAEKAMESGVPFLALGRELIVDPQWVEKVESGREAEIRTELSTEDREKLVVPKPLWKAIVNTPGWFPVAEHKQKSAE